MRNGMECGWTTWMIEGGNDEHGTDERDDSQSKMEARSSRLFLLLDGSPGPDASCPEHVPHSWGRNG